MKKIYINFDLGILESSKAFLFVSLGTSYERLNELLEQVVSYAFNDFPFRLKKKPIILFYNALLCEEPCSGIQVI